MNYIGNNSYSKSKLFKKKYYRTRNGKIFANLSLSVLFKSIIVIISLITVPLTLNYLDKTRYGLWIALYSLLNWIFIFDIGIGNGLRNKVTELKAQDKASEIKNYVSTSYVIFGFLAIILAVLFIIINRFIDWSRVLNAPDAMKYELSSTIYIIFVVMCFSFVLKLIDSVLAGDLKNSISGLISVIAHILSLIGIILLAKFTTPSILKYALMYTGTNLIVTLFASIFLYSGMYKEYSPSIKNVDLSLSKDLVSVGVKFFFISLSMNLMFTANGLIISNLLGPEYVIDYSINLKYFTVSSMLFTLLVQPLWSGYGDAYHRNDYEWIKKTFSLLHKLLLIMVCILILMIIAQKWIFYIWIGDKIQVDYSLSILFGLYCLVNMLNSIYNPFVNATSKIKLQMILYIILSILYLIMAVIFVKYLNLGIKGIVLALILLHDLPLAIIMKIQSKKILSGAPGIWQQ